jgi:uncharacterized membrane protein YfcA
MVGGGGLIQLPVFLLVQPQLTLVQTVATNKTASLFGSLVAAVKYVRKVPVHWPRLYPAMAGAAIGSLGGALLVSRMVKGRFMPVVILALILVLIYTAVKKDMGQQTAHRDYTPTQALVYAVLTGLVIGFYDGLIGPGTGSFLIFALIAVFGHRFLQASAEAKVLNCVTNLSAIVFFLSRGQVLWAFALPMAAANMAGNFLGAQFAISKGSGFIRICFLIVVSALILRLAYVYLL